MKREELRKKMGGRILESYYDYASVKNLVYEGLEFGLDCIQVFPNMLPKVQEVLEGRELDICAVITYPHGTFLPEQKAFEIKDALESGATQVEFVIHNINVRSGNWELVREEFQACRKAAGEHVLKAIVEVEWLTDEQIKRVSQLAIEEGVDRLTTSIGVYTMPDEKKNDVLIRCKPDDVKKIKAIVGEQVKVVAQGGINSVEMAEELLLAGADYISSEFAAEILRNCAK